MDNRENYNFLYVIENIEFELINTEDKLWVVNVSRES